MSDPGRTAAREADSRTRELSQPPAERGSAGATAVGIGAELGRYVILRRVGEGGMGIVYEAHDPELGRTIALKLLWPSRRTPERMAKLRREAQAMARISHPNVVQVFDVGSYGEHVFLAMELVRGRNLSQWLGERRRPWPAVLAVMMEAARGLAAAHAAGLVHRDVKPGNILVDELGHAKVGDFGLAHAIVEAEPTGDPASRSSSDSDAPVVSLDVTAAGAGTPNYMPPEQHLGTSVDARGDQYAFCVTLWEALFGARPYRGDELHALLLAKLEHDPRPPRGASVPKWIVTVCMRGLSPRVEQRYASMDELLARLDGGRHRLRPWLVGGGAAVVSAALVAALSPRSRCDDALRELDGIWDDAVKAELRRAVGASDQPWAAPTWTSASTRVDDWATRWIGVRGTVCEQATATDEGTELDRRLACLHGGRAALATVLGLVRDGETAVLRDAVSTVTELPAPERCLLDGPAQELDEPARARLARAREQLARAEALGRAGHPKDGLALVDAELAAIDAVAQPGLIAEIHTMRGVLLKLEGDGEAAERELEQGYWLAREQDDDATMLRSATQLVSVVGWDLARVNDGLEWARHAEAALTRSGADATAQAALLDVHGSVLRRGGHYDEARVVLERARDLWATLGEHDLRYASALNNFAGLELGVGKLDEALASYQRALEIQRAVLGDDHPTLAATLGGIGISHYSKGEYAEARAPLERAVALREATLGEEHPLLAVSLNNLGIDLLRLGDYDASLATHRRALAIRERALDPDHPDIAESLNNLGVVLQEQDRFAEAEPYFARCVAIDERRLGPEHPSLVGPLNNVGIVLRGQQRPADAERWHRRALDIATRKLGEAHVATANASLGVAETMVARERWADALPLFERASAIYATQDGEPNNRAEALFGLARAHWGLAQDRERARAEGELALAAYERSGATGARGRAAVRAWLDGLPR